MGQTERNLLWVCVGLIFVGLIVLTVVVFAELNEINRHLLASAGSVSAAETGGSLQLDETGSGQPVTGAPSAPSWGGQTSHVGIAGVQALTDTVGMTVTVRAYGAGDLLFEPPVLQSEEGQVYPVAAESLEQARLEFLNLVTRGEATVYLEFSGRLAPTSGLWLVFNPGQEPTSTTAPPLQVAVPFRTGEGGGGD